jgi:hypothetical protein
MYLWVLAYGGLRDDQLGVDKLLEGIRAAGAGYACVCFFKSSLTQRERKKTKAGEI